MKTKFYIVVLLVGVFVQTFPAHGAETDQFLALEAEINDSGPALNRYLNEQAAVFLAIENSHRNRTETAEKLAIKFYYHLFRGLQSSRLRSWAFTSDEVDRFPDLSVGYFEHYKKSIYDMRSFPFLMPMTRTIRIGNVRFGIDKFGHFLGFGRRGYKSYLKYRKRGMSDEEATRKVIRYWIFSERYFVGNLTDGIFSYADIEANYQGMQMLRSLGEGENAHLKMVDGQWVLTRPIDAMPFITPDFDESYNHNHYSFMRKDHVFEGLCERYYEKLSLPIVSERFKLYDETPKSIVKDETDRYYAEREEDPRKLQSLDCMCESLAKENQ